MLAAIELEREEVYIANVVPWRPPGNRTPSPQEAEICKPFIRRQIELVDPDVLVFLGGASAKLLAGTSDGILRLRGKWLGYDTGARQIKCDRDAASGLSAQDADPEAAGLARFPEDQGPRSTGWE